MPWRELSTMSQRREFGQRASQREISFSRLCREYGISRKTGYKWLKRYLTDENLADRSRRPHKSPRHSTWATEEAVIDLRLKYGWCGRKIRTVMLREGFDHVPSASTITEILRRHGLLDPEEAKPYSYTRFEMEAPNQLWQMDFKGYLSLSDGSACHPLTVLDDHSRYLLALAACPNETRQTVEDHLTAVFKENGLPDRMLMDNGSPWGWGTERFTTLSAWLIRLGITVTHGRPYHPQTQGKDERVHKTMVREILRRKQLATMADCERAFLEWRQVYNHVRPHDSLGSKTPAECYQRSFKEFPAALPTICYDGSFVVRKVDSFGKISFKNKAFRIGRAFCHMPVGLRPTDDGVYDVFFCHQRVNRVDLRSDDTDEEV